MEDIKLEQIVSYRGGRPRLSDTVSTELNLKRAYYRNWKNNRRLKWISENGPCAVCGSWEQLEIDHINSEDKKVPISSLWSCSIVRRETELSKCQVLCLRHHIEKSVSERTKIAQHSTNSMYSAGCRCIECTSAHATYMRERNRVYKRDRRSEYARRKEITVLPVAVNPCRCGCGDLAVNQFLRGHNRRNIISDGSN